VISWIRPHGRDGEGSVSRDGIFGALHERLEIKDRISVIGSINEKRQGCWNSIGLDAHLTRSKTRFWLWPGFRVISRGLMQRSLFGSGDTGSNNNEEQNSY
jgi:hypothetical protein